MDHLRPYQLECLEAIDHSLREENVHRQLVVKATGTGKTVTFAALINQRGGKFVVIAHRDELIEQAAEKVLHYNPGLIVDVEQASAKARPSADVFVCSIATIGREGSDRWARLVAFLTRDPDTPVTIIIDEAHHAAAKSYRNVLEGIGLICKKEEFKNDPRNVLLVGFTATPNRSDNVGLHNIFEKVVYTFSIKDAIQQGWLVDIVAHRIYSHSNLDNVGVRAGEFVENQLSAEVNTEERNELIVRGYIDHAENKKTIVFCVDVAHVRAVTELFCKNGIAAELVVGETPKDYRRAVIKRFRSGETRVLVNCMVATEGFDVPDVEAVIMARPTKSQTVYIQQLGRGLRPAVNLPPRSSIEERLALIAASHKPHVHVMDVVDNTTRHTPVMVTSLFGLNRAINLRGRPMMQVVQDIEDLAHTRPDVRLDNIKDVQRLDDIRTKAIKVDIWAAIEIPKAVEEHSNYRFQRFGEENNFQLHVDKNETIVVHETTLGNWQAVREFTASVNETTGEIVKHPPMREVLGEAPSMEEAFSRTDSYIEQVYSDRVTLFDQSAPWRKYDVSDGQLNYLKRFFKVYQLPGDGKWYVNDSEGTPRRLTRGLASDLLGQRFNSSKSQSHAHA